MIAFLILSSKRYLSFLASNLRCLDVLRLGIMLESSEVSTMHDAARGISSLYVSSPVLVLKVFARRLIDSRSFRAFSCSKLRIKGRGFISRFLSCGTWIRTRIWFHFLQNTFLPPWRIYPFSLARIVLKQVVDSLETLFRLMTNIYQKTMNTYSFIPYTSSHTEAALKGFISGEITRYHRLSTLPSDRDQTINLFYTRQIYLCPLPYDSEP